MRKLKVVLTVLLALTVSLALFACGGGKNKGKGKGQIAGVTIGNQLALTEKDTASTLSTKKATLKVSVTYTDGTTAELTADDWEFTEDSLKNLQTTGEGANATYVIGNYTLDVQPTANNDKHLVGTATAVVDHDWGAADANGVQTCSVEGATKTATKTDVTVEFAGYHDTPIADIVKYADTTLDENAQRIKAFGLTGSGADPHTATVGRLEKGMTISVRGKMIATSDANTYYFPIIGLANRQTDAGFVVRNDGWGIYGGIGGGGVLAKSGLSDHTITAGTPAADTQDWEAYFEGAGSSTTDFLTEQDVELTWRFVEKTDGTTTYNVVELGFFDYTINRSYTVRVKVPTRQFYDTVLHGEMIKMNITDITVIQMLNLEDIVSAKLKTGAKSTYLENEMFDYSTIDLQAKFQQDAAGTTRPFEVFDLYATTDATVAATSEWINLETNKLTASMKNYKAVLTVGEIIKEHVFTATELPVQIKTNAVDNANANDVTIGTTKFIANQLDVIPFTQGTGNTAQVTLVGAAASLTAAQKAVLNNTAKNHYAAFTIYQNGPTKFSTTGTPAFVGTEGKAQVRENGTALDVVVALDKTVIGTTKTVKLTGVNDQDILIDVSGITAYTYYSEVKTFAPVYLNKAGTVEITYSVATNPTLTATANGVYAPKDVRLTIGGSRFALSSAVSGTAWKTEPTAIGRTGVSVVVSNEAGKTKITYTIEEDITSPSEISIQLATNETEGGWTVQVADIIYPEFGFADNGTDTTGYYVADKDVLLYVDGTNLYIVEGRGFHNMVTRANAVRGTLGISLNAGAATPAEYKLKLYTGKQDLSYVVNGDKSVTFTNSSPVEGLISGEFVTFGTLDNSKDSDRGAYLLIKVDTTKLGYTSSDSYAFELDPDLDASDGLAGTYYAYDATTKKITVKTYSLAADAATVALNTNGNCALATSRAYEVKESDTTVYYAGVYEVYTGEHTWSAEKNADGYYACTVCGSLKAYKGDETEPVVAKDAAIPALGDNLADSGLTAFFTLGKATGDWASQALVTKEGNMIITLPNLDPWNNTVADMADATAREKELAAKLVGANCFPAGENLFNGGTWDVFLNKEDSPRVAISISKTFGISYYLNGELKVSYPASKAVGSGTVADVAELFLSLAGRKGLTLNVGDSAPMSNVMLIKAGYDATKIKEIYDSEQPAAATALTTIDNAPATRAAANTLPSATNQVTIGEVGGVLGFTGTNPAWRYQIQPGQKIVLKGTMQANMTDELNYHTAIMNAFGSTFSAFLRGDNWTGDANLTWGVAIGCNTEGSTLDPGPDGATDVDKFWDGAREIYKDCDVEFTFDATDVYGDISKDGVCSGEFKMIFKAINKTDATKFYICTATFSLAQPQSWWVREGQTWEDLTIGIGGEACYIVLNASEVNPS